LAKIKIIILVVFFKKIGNFNFNFGIFH